MCHWTSAELVGRDAKSRGCDVPLETFGFGARSESWRKVVDELRIQYGGCAVSIATSGDALQNQNAALEIICEVSWRMRKVCKDCSEQPRISDTKDA